MHVEGGHHRNVLIQIVVIIKVQNQYPLAKEIPLIYTLSREEAAGAADDDPLLASFGRVELTIEEAINADSSMNMENFVQGSSQEMNVIDGSSHSTHPVAKEVRPYDVCFAWYTPGTFQRWDPVAGTVESNFDKDQVAVLQCAYDCFWLIASETDLLYERLRQSDHLTSDEIMRTLDKLQHIALHYMKDIACHQANDVVHPEVPIRSICTPSTSTTRPLDHQNSSRTQHQMQLLCHHNKL